MKVLHVYVDTSVIGGCNDVNFSSDSLALWRHFKSGKYVQILSELTLRELAQAPLGVRSRIEEIPSEYQILLSDSDAADGLAQSYLDRAVVGAKSYADALHVALTTLGGADVIVSWNFKHLVNLGKIRMFNAVNLEQGYPMIEIRTPREVMCDE